MANYTSTYDPIKLTKQFKMKRELNKWGKIFCIRGNMNYFVGVMDLYSATVY